MTDLVIRDETMAGKATGNELVLSTLDDTITVRELVRLRVREEVARYNAKLGEIFHGLVQPTDAEIELNAYRMRTPRRLDWEKQADVALDAFSKNGFVILIGGRQVDELDEQIDVREGLDIAFIKLVPLVGG